MICMGGGKGVWFSSSGSSSPPLCPASSFLAFCANKRVHCPSSLCLLCVCVDVPSARCRWGAWSAPAGCLASWFWLEVSSVHRLCPDSASGRDWSASAATGDMIHRVLRRLTETLYIEYCNGTTLFTFRVFPVPEPLRLGPGEPTPPAGAPPTPKAAGQVAPETVKGKRRHGG